MINIFKHHFIKASFIVLIGSFSINILNYVFNLAMGRMLEPSKFGEVASLMGLFAIIAVPAVALTRLMAKYTAGFKAKKEISLIGDLVKLVTRRSLIIGLAMLVVFCLLIPFLSEFFKIDKLPFLIFGLALPISLITAVNQGILQGLQKFTHFSLIGVIGSMAKLILAVVFVILGFSVPGVMAALVLSGFCAYLYGLFKVKQQLKAETINQKKQTKLQIPWKEVRSYASVIFWTSLLLVLLLNVDIILAKHYLSPYLAGQYAVLSLIGKIIIYGSGAFVTVMFPMVSAARANGDGKEKNLLKMSFIIIAGVSGLTLILFVLFPQLVIKMLFGAKYLSVAPYLHWFGLAMLFSALAQVLIQYFMAIHYRKHLYPFGLIIALQVLLVVFFHANIWQITFAILSSNFILLAAMIIVYYIQTLRTKVYEKF